MPKLPNILAKVTSPPDITCFELVQVCPSRIGQASLTVSMNKGFSKETVYSHLYEIKKSRVNLKISTPKKVSSAPTTPKKRKVATDAEENS